VQQIRTLQNDPKKQVLLDEDIPACY